MQVAAASSSHQAVSASGCVNCPEMSPVWIFVAVAVCVHLVISKFKLLRSSLLIPGPWFIPGIGNVQFMSEIRPEALFVLVEKMRRRFRSTFRIWVGPQLWVFLHGADETRQALHESSLVRADTFQLLSAVIGNGLLISEGRHWRSHRRALGAAFQPSVLASFSERIRHHAEVFAERVLRAGDVDVTEFVFPCVLDAICETSMGKNLQTQEDAKSPYTEAFHETSHLLFKRMVNPLLASDLIYNRTAASKRLAKSIAVIHALTEGVIKEQADSLKSLDADEAKQRRSLLRILLTTEIDGKPLTFQEIKDEVNTFLFAGVDTTSAAMGFVLFCLAKFPECQQKLMAEISAEDDIHAMPYLDKFINECLRFYTIVPLTGRQVTQTIRIGAFDLHPGTTLWVNMYGLAHDEQYFPEPHAFNPERFDGVIPGYAFVPFSAGPHSCIGRKYAMMILKILTVTTLRRCEVELKNAGEELVLMAEMVLKSKNGIQLRFRGRGGVRSGK